MATADVEQPAPAPSPAVPDYLASPNAVLGDKDAQWRYGRAPDYSKTRKSWEETKKMNHEAGSLPQLVENLVKNWEVEASFKSQLKDWRTVNHEKYSFAINGGPPQTGEHMLKVGTYNAIIAPNEYYSPENSDFASSHKTFKRMMPTFAWEVLEVYSGPPKVAFKWRHWGTMKNDYVGFNDKGEKVTAKAHGGVIDITGITVATVDEQVRLQEVNTYFDPLEMFRQIAPQGIVNKETVSEKVDRSKALDTTPEDQAQADTTTVDKTSVDTTPAGKTSVDATPVPWNDGVQIAKEHNTLGTEHSADAAPPAPGAPATTRDAADDDEDVFHDAADSEEVEKHLEQPAEVVHPHPKNMEHAVQPEAGQAVAASADSQETKATHEELSRISPAECPFLMNRE